MADALLQAVQDAVVAVGTGDKVEAVAPGNAGESFRHFESAMEKRIQKVILGQTLTTDIDGKGSYAAARVHNEVREDRRQSDLRLVTDTVQRIVNALVGLNFPAAEPPRFLLEDVQGLEADRAARDVDLAKANPGLRFTPEYYQDVYGFEAGHFELTATPPPSPPAKTRAGGAPFGAGAFADGGDRRITPDQQEIEDLADAALGMVVNPIPPADIRAAIEAANGPEDLADRLGEMAGREPLEGFRESLERALFMADVMGYGNSEQRTGEKNET